MWQCEDYLVFDNESPKPTERKKKKVCVYTYIYLYLCLLQSPRIPGLHGN